MLKSFNKNQKKKKKATKINKTTANSEFVREKLQLPYNPTAHHFGQSKSPFHKSKSVWHSQLSRRSIESKVFNEMKSQAIKSRKIVLESTRSNYRSTKLPNLDNNGNSFNFGTILKQMIEKNSENIKSSTKKSFIFSYKDSSSRDKQDYQMIKSKCDQLSKLLSQNKKQASSTKKQKKRIQKIVTQNSIGQKQYTSSRKNSSIDDIHLRGSKQQGLTEKIKSQEKQFFKTNIQNINQAMDHEKRISTEPTIPIQVKIKNNLQEAKVNRKKKIDYIRDRVHMKSKLTILKVELLKKYSAIRENILEQGEATNSNFQKSKQNSSLQLQNTPFQ